MLGLLGLHAVISPSQGPKPLISCSRRSTYLSKNLSIYPHVLGAVLILTSSQRDQLDWCLCGAAETLSRKFDRHLSMFKSSNAVFPLLFVCALLNALVSAQSAQTAEARGAYIRYNGTVSARFYQPDCSTYNVAPEKGSTLYVGTYPTWDPNPIFFEIHHIASEDCNQIDCPFDYSPTKAKRQFTILSYDDLSNLWFTSAAYVCYKNGSTCDVGFTWNPYYVVAQLLDLSKATITGTDMLGAPGYVVRGDQETWVSNDTIPAYFDLTLWSSNITSTNRTSKSHCITGDKEYSWYIFSSKSIRF